MRIRWPIGTDQENAISQWRIPGTWVNSNPFLAWYEIAPDVWNWHDGVDLNNNSPTWNADFHSAIVAPTDGVVTFAGKGGGSWGHIVNIKHYDEAGCMFVTSFGHIESPIVEAGDVVLLGQRIASVGDGDGYYHQSGAHLHFRVSTTDLLLRIPNQWSGTNKAILLANFVDPVTFIKERFLAENPDTLKAFRDRLGGLPDDFPILILPGIPAQEPTEIVTAYQLTAADLRTPIVVTPPDPNATVTTNGLRVRTGPSTTAAQLVVNGVYATLNAGARVTVEASGTAGWSKLVAPYAGNYVSSLYLNFD